MLEVILVYINITILTFICLFRFLVYDPYDHYFPFAIETFKLPASCACHNGPYAETH